jgi:hypothetical protein
MWKWIVETLFELLKTVSGFVLFCRAAGQLGFRPPIEFYWSHTIRHTRARAVGLLWTSDQLVTEAATYTSHNKHKKLTSMISAGFETAIPATERQQTYALDRTATRIGMRWCLGNILEWMAGIRSVRILLLWVILMKLCSTERSGLLCDTRWNILVVVLRHGSCKCDRDYRRCGCVYLSLWKVTGKGKWHIIRERVLRQRKTVMHLYQIDVWVQNNFLSLNNFLNQTIKFTQDENCIKFLRFKSNY